MIVDNRPGANHIIGGQLTQKSPPDGYTMQVIPEGWVINASMYSKLPFDPVRDFTPIASIGAGSERARRSILRSRCAT